MIKQQKPYKKFSTQNKKKKVILEKESGMIVNFNSNKRFPIVSLPEVIVAPIMTRYFRFISASSATLASLTIYDLLNTSTLAATTVLAYCNYAAVRLKRLRILAPVTTQGTSVTVAVTPNAADTGTNFFNAVPERYLDTSASIDIPAYVSLTPSLETPLGSWHLNRATDGALCLVSAPQGSTMDLLLEFIPFYAGTAPPYTRSVAGATVGVTYCAPVCTAMIPQGIATI